MAIRFRRVSRLCDPTNKEAGKKVYPVISYQYDTSATLDEFAKEIAPKAKGRRRRKILRSLIFQGFVSVFVPTRTFVCLPGRLPVRMD